MTADKKYWAALNLCTEAAAVNLRKMANYFTSMENAWRAGDFELRKAGLKEKVILAIKKGREIIDPDREWDKILKNGIGIVTFKENIFPEQLREIPDPPAMIYIKGELKISDEISVGVVGTRRMSQYGRQITEEITSEIASAGITIISGLARGVDTVAHQTAIEAGSRTIAVLGCGIDNASIYPPENIILAKKIVEGRGAVVSEFHLGTPPLKHHFPMRNRIISGLSLAVLVTECPVPSGALITARTAIEQGRDVFAVPGDIRSKSSEGSNNLIKLGAKAVTKGSEILDELGILVKKDDNRVIARTKEEELILRVLDQKPQAIDIIAKKSKLNISLASSTLTMLEIRGIVRNVGMNEYIKKR